MPTAIPESTGDAEKEDKNTNENRPDRMRVALKAHVLRERARKRQQREAEVEEERLRRERERQDVMTLGQTQIQITELETRLSELKEEKHQLFRQLKKVLHEDDNRKRQLSKENEMIAAPVSSSPMLAISELHRPLFLASGPPTTNQQQQVQQQQQQGTKRTFKTPHQLKHLPPIDDQRRPHDIVRAVLWNKPSQYTNQPQTSFYAVPPSAEQRAPIVYYPTQRSTEQVIPRGTQAIYDLYPMPPNVRPTSQQQPTHVTVHGSSIPITPAQPVSKTGSITSGYPVRIVTPYQQPNQIYQIGGPPPGARPMYPTQNVQPLSGYSQQRE